jgi:parallel beta-helix repeat protein
VTLTLGSGQAVAASPRTWVVDDDRKQCPQAEKTSINKAVKAARAGSVIQVCPGRYPESVTVDKPLTLKGDPDAVKAVDCFSSLRPTADSDTQAIVAAPADAPDDALAVLFDLQADNVDLQGFVLLGQTASSSHAVVTSPGHSGYRVHDNLIMANTVGALFRSSGALPSSFDSNCLRENRWGLANQFMPLVNAQIHHNSSFGTLDYVYELVRGTDGVILDHNVSTADNIGYFFWSSKSTIALENTVTSASIGMRSYGANEDLHIIGNTLEVRTAGVAQPSTLPSDPQPEPNPRALIQENTITGKGANAGIGMGTRALQDSQILDNVVTGLDGQGIALLAGNTNNVLRGNTVTNNGKNGIWAGAGAGGNTFEANEMLGNGRINGSGGVDARDDHARDFNVWANVWHGNVCQTDIPQGTICGVGAATEDG